MMGYLRVYSIILIALLAGCGIQRNLVIPGQERHKAQPVSDAPLDMSAPQLPPEDQDGTPGSPDTALPDNAHAGAAPDASNPAAK